MRIKNTGFKNEIQKVLKSDKFMQQVLQNIKDHKSFMKEENLLLF